MDIISAASFKALMNNLKDSETNLATLLYIKAKETDKNPDSFESTNLGKFISSNATILSLESVQNGMLPDLPLEKPLYILCDHGHISELAALYLDISGFDTYNIEGGFQAVQATET